MRRNKTKEEKRSVPGLHSTVPVVPDHVWWATCKQSCDLRPFRAMDAVCVNERALFLGCPLPLLNVRVDMLSPALRAPLAISPRQLRSNEFPVFQSVLLDQPPQLVVLFLAPAKLNPALGKIGVLASHGHVHVHAFLGLRAWRNLFSANKRHKFDDSMLCWRAAGLPLWRNLFSPQISPSRPCNLQLLLFGTV